ncbi:hypothetical protein AGMMS49992_28600 [Clostridia bacterium]|nr:hypothetical protein AGMMS49992_28600 [Clostridia bacterium]
MALDRTEWGLTERGFRRPEYVDLLDAYEFEARALFGQKANLTVRSPLGMFLRIFAWFSALLFQVLEHVYNSRFIDTAVGTSMLNIGRMIGLHLLSAQRAYGNLEFTGAPGVVIPAGYLVCNIENWIVGTTQRGVIGADGKVLIPARAQLPGPDGNVPPNTLTIIYNPGIPEGIDSVTNPAKFVGGRDRETDEEYRDRYYKSVDFAGGVNTEAIAAEILQKAEGVLSAIVFENDTDYTDDQGLPPHSIEAVVFGGLDADIGQAIFRRKAAGIQTFGNVHTSIVSTNGLTYDILFSRPTPVFIWFEIWALEIEPQAYDVDVIGEIKTALAEWVGTTGARGMGIGQPVKYKWVPEVVNGVPGVVNYELTMSTDGVNYGYDDIQIGTREKAMCDVTNVTVSVI